MDGETGRGQKCFLSNGGMPERCTYMFALWGVSLGILSNDCPECLGQMGLPALVKPSCVSSRSFIAWSIKYVH